ncbi:MAG: TIM barrel protein [Rhodobacteraceae bacterium]|nr:TIM barrel protein [Paracoccaceae bacterium]
MKGFAANLSMLFSELPFLDRFSAANKAGFQAVEILFPYDHSTDQIKQALDDCGLPLVLINTPPGDVAKGERGHAAVSGAEALFSASLGKALDYATALGAGHIHVMSGNARGKAAKQTLIANLSHATTLAPGQSFLIEPLNGFDMPGYFLDDLALAREVIETTAAANLGLQFDIFHVARMGLNPLEMWRQFRNLVRHIQIAGPPARNEPLPSEVDYQNLIAEIRADGYEGFISAEYRPKGKTTDGIGWLAELSA